MSKPDSLDEILTQYGYFLGLAYEDESGNLATHEVGKVKQVLEAYIEKQCLEARIEDLENIRVLYYGDGSPPEVYIHSHLLSDFTKGLKKQLTNKQQPQGGKK